MAERDRRGDDPTADDLDEELLDDALDDDVLDEDDVEEQTGRPARTRSGTATKARPRAEGVKPAKKKVAGRVGPLGRIGRFIREVVAELRKVIWPTRKELLTYTAVVLVFVTVIMAIVAGLDLGFARLALMVFGSSGGSGSQ